MNLLKGTHTVTNLVLGNFEYGNGSFTLGGTGDLYVSDEYIGSSGVGTFNQSGGIHSSTNLYLGELFGSEGYYTLTNGSLDDMENSFNRAVMSVYFWGIYTSAQMPVAMVYTRCLVAR